MSTELIEAVRFLANKNWCPGTGGNFSIRQDSKVLITRSGVDKLELAAKDLVTPDAKDSSAETLIHTKIYELYPSANAVFHTHSPRSTQLSLKNLDKERLEFTGYEMLKALEGNTTHEVIEVLPIFPNSQDMPAFVELITPQLKQHKNIHGFLMAGHGLYTWATTVSAARRHIETYEFLFECLDHD